MNFNSCTFHIGLLVYRVKHKVKIETIKIYASIYRYNLHVGKI